MNYKVKCTGYKKEERYFTIGKVYEVIDNTITNDHGYTYGKLFFYNDIIEWLSDWYTFEKIANNQKIVITTDGTETLARLYEGKKVIKSATAKCSPDDTFDFKNGVEIAFNRLMGVKAVKEEKANPHKYKSGDKVKIIANTCCHGMKEGEIITLDHIICRGANKTNAWFTKEYHKKWYIRECDFEPCDEVATPKYYNGKVVCVQNEYAPYIPINGFTVGKVYTVTDGIITDDTGWTCKIPAETIERLCAIIGNKFIPFVE